MDKCWEKVREFHIAFSNPASDVPVKMEAERAAKRYKWMLEEIDEFIEAHTLTDQADAMIDLMYFALGTLVEMGVKPQKLFDIVHEANMTKLWEDGKPRYNADGKIIKPPSWDDPFGKLEEAIFTP
ncbi:MAG: hypothetical protein LBS21_14415 [Clostridiales bacterium]|jgi:predicted HAD superfamily Cof-like phosphohydrolase|nr:hypothetical protein [Clostridiales bacterium]